MAKQIVVLGGGVGGTLAANLLVRKLRRNEADVVLVDEDGQHIYQPGFLYVALGEKDPAVLTRPVRSLLSRRVRLLRAHVARVDPERQVVHTEKGELNYDELLIATGSHVAPERIPGLQEGGHHFYTREAAAVLRDTLNLLKGGRVVIGAASLPYKCPPAPLEFTFMLEARLERLGLREKMELHFAYPLQRVFPIDSVADLATPLLEQGGVRIHTGFQTERVDADKRQVIARDGRSLPYDLLVMIPPHRGAQFVLDSGLGEGAGWIPTDRHSMKALRHPHMFVIGDATDLPVSKSGAAAHYEAEVAADNLLSDLRGEAVAHEYHGSVMCFMETGFGEATMIQFNYHQPPSPPRPSRFYHWEKAVFNQAYWWLLPQGRLPGERIRPARGTAGDPSHSAGDD